MLFHDNIDLAFQPLIQVTNGEEEVFGQYMYMYHDKEGNHYFKHSLTRNYVVINSDNEIVQGQIENLSMD